MRKHPKTPPYLRGYYRGRKKEQTLFAARNLWFRLYIAWTGRLTL